MATSTLEAQVIQYSEPDREDARSLNFEIIGKVAGNVLIYKNSRDLHYIAVYDLNMNLLSKERFDFLPERIKLLSSDFIQYNDFVYFLYQYQFKGNVFAMAVKLDGNAKRIGEPVLLDSTSNLSHIENSKIYSFVNSEDKQKILAFKINTKSPNEHIVITSVFNKDLQLLEKNSALVGMPERNDFLGEFGIGNDGAIVCLRQSGSSQNDNINKINLLVKPFGSNYFTDNPLPLKGVFLDNPHIKIDNKNQHFLITSFYSKIKRGNIDGLYYTLWDIPANKELVNAVTTFSEEFREDARSQNSLKSAFNDFYLKNLILRKDGGFMVIAESAYMSNRGNNLNRYDYLNGSPFFNPLYGGNFMMSPYYYNPFYNPMGYYPWGGFGRFGGMGYNGMNNINRYYVDNIAIMSFEPGGKMEWSNVIRKSQYDDNTDNFLGYGLLNAGDKLRFIFNIQERRNNLITDQALSADGQIDRNPMIKNPEKGYDFMPRHAKQIGARVAIIPCMYRGYTCFSKVEF